MHISDLKNKKIGILGFGMEGAAVGRFLAKNHLPFSVLDQADKGIEIQQTGVKPEKIFTGPGYLGHAEEFDVLFRSPGIRINAPELKVAKDNGAVITSQVKFFLENTKAKIIGITGTKGKGTTAKLLYEILQNAQVPVYLAGNFGVDMLPLLDSAQPEEYIILELSSFQLQDLEISPHIAVVLMVVPEHLDYHASTEEYIQAKHSITKFQIKSDIAVVNSDFENSMQIGKLGAAKKLFVQALPAEQVEKKDPFLIYKPEQYLKIKDGVFSEELHGNIYFVVNGDLHLLMNATEVPLRGFHNMQNVGAAAAVAHTLEIKESIIVDSIKNYKGLEHRLELVNEANGIKFYNDSIGTTPGSALAAIKAFHEPVFAIVGGADKQADYAQFAADLTKQKNLRGLILLGVIAPKLQAALEQHNFSGKIFSGAQSMEQAFAQALSAAEKGDVVLLAPGTASFDMFKDYKDRGDQFKKEVGKLL